MEREERERERRRERRKKAYSLYTSGWIERGSGLLTKYQ